MDLLDWQIPLDTYGIKLGKPHQIKDNDTPCAEILQHCGLTASVTQTTLAAVLRTNCR